MNCDRKTFLKMSGMMASGLAVGTLPFLKSCAPAEQQADTAFGLQLYTLRDVITDDPEATLRQVAEYGYTEIESYEGPMGMWWNMGNNGFKDLMDELGMTAISTHANVFEDFERKANEAAEIGLKFIVSPWIGPQDSLDDYREIADQFNEMGEIANSAGIRFAYHNHAYTFEEQDGQMPQDVLMENTDPDLVEYQMDIYWVALAGEDPAAWIEKYPGRFTTCHVKDLSNGANPESTILGTGSIDYQELLPFSAEHGMENFIVEQEAYTGTTPMDAIRENAEYMRGIDI
ncbi:sugar phosphate isomerase/epimerase [Rhodohalobacter sp. SW132]|uniref:sugar phosphate isomerase/epimerase family protein n=1 Tax=Rhodohalobacter sp. SW132 TaxID=2293433 RepID=UPI000E266EA6|nr:sugar phosphate isomerase/epimerase [Rhodohalobacter sp. SW132]REL38900.1 sugar phosphate isomerase/epimerase [Rhodohalobacter sp. SW132]